MTARSELQRDDRALVALPSTRDGGSIALLRGRLRASVVGFAVVSVLSGIAVGLLATTISIGPIVGVVAIAAGLVALAALPRWVAWVESPIDPIETERRQLGELLERARLDALRDALTGLGNQRAFEEELSSRANQDRREDESVALVLIDLDDLKAVNDGQGHAAGDRLLAMTGRLIDGLIRRGDLAFRIGGDEFAILLPGSDGETAYVTARRLLSAALEGRSTDLSFPSFSFSAGVAAFPEPSRDAGQLRLHADAALYSAKRHGRTTVEVFDPNRHAVTGDERSLPELSAAVTDVVSRGALRPVYQGIFDVATGHPIGYEGLVRPDPSTGFSDASALFVAAEAVGRTVELDMAAVGAVVSGIASLPEGCYLSINVSPRTIETTDFSPMDLIAILSRHGIPSGRVVIEITERELVSDLARLQRNLEACQAVGFRTAIDDVGAGNAGLSLLSQIRFDVVKVDLSLVQRGILGEAGESVLRALRGLADRWEATIVAEGVETPQHLEVIRALGLHAAQGYLLARPSEALAADPVNIGALIERWQIGRRLEAEMRAEEDPDAA